MKFHVPSRQKGLFLMQTIRICQGYCLDEVLLAVEISKVLFQVEQQTFEINSSIDL